MNRPANWRRWVGLTALILVLFVTNFRQEQLRRDAQSAQDSQTTQLCDAMEDLRAAVVIGQQEAASNPLPAPSSLPPDVKAIVDFVNARQSQGSAAVMAQVDAARCPAKLRRELHR
jgi:hypothetical protein